MNRGKTADRTLSKAAKKDNASGTIALNKRARHEFFLSQKFEAGIALQGWELKSIREGRVQLTESYINLHKGEAYLASANITPLTSASTHVIAEPQRNRKLLLHSRELELAHLRRKSTRMCRSHPSNVQPSDPCHQALATTLPQFGLQFAQADAFHC